MKNYIRFTVKTIIICEMLENLNEKFANLSDKPPVWILRPPSPA